MIAPARVYESEFLGFDRNSCFKSLTALSLSVTTRLRIYTVTSYMTPFNNLWNWQHIVSTAAFEMQHLPRFFMPDDDMEHMLFDGGSIYFRVVGDCLHGGMGRLCDALIEVASFGRMLPTVDMSSLTDDLGNRERGYGFSSEPKNHLDEKKDHLLRLVLSTRELRERFFVRLEPGRMIINRSKCIQYLQEVGEVACQAAALVLTCCGQPCRGTELSGLSPINTEHGVRNIFVKEGRVMLFQLRQKTQSVTGHYSVSLEM